MTRMVFHWLVDVILDHHTGRGRMCETSGKSRNQDLPKTRICVLYFPVMALFILTHYAGLTRGSWNAVAAAQVLEITFVVVIVRLVCQKTTLTTQMHKSTNFRIL